MPLAKLDLLEVMILLGKMFLRVLLLLFPGKKIVVVTTDNGANNMIKGNERWRDRRWYCVAAHMLVR